MKMARRNGMSEYKGARVHRYNGAESARVQECKDIRVHRDVRVQECKVAKVQASRYLTSTRK